MTERVLRVRVSGRAQAEIRKIFFYTLQRWGDEQANHYQQLLRDTFSELARFPAIGVERSDIASGLRSRVVGSHVVLYRVREAEIVIVRVVHTRQDPGSPSL